MGRANILCPPQLFHGGGGGIPPGPVLPTPLQSILATMDPFRFHLKINCLYGGAYMLNWEVLVCYSLWVIPR